MRPTKSKKLKKMLQEFLESFGITGQPSIAEVFLILLNENKNFISNVPFDIIQTIFDLLSFYGEGFKKMDLEVINEVYHKFVKKIDTIQFELPPKIERLFSQNPKLKYILKFNQDLITTPSSDISSLSIQKLFQNFISTPKHEFKKLQKLEEKDKNENLHNLTDFQVLSFRIHTLYESFRYIFGLLLFLIDNIIGNQVKPIEKYLSSKLNINSDFYEININQRRHWRKCEPDLKSYFSANYNNIGIVLNYIMNLKTFRNFTGHRFRDVQQKDISEGIFHTDFGQTYSIEELEQSYYNLIGIWNMFHYSLQLLISLMIEKISECHLISEWGAIPPV